MKTDFNDFVEIFTSLTCKKLWCLSHASPVMKIQRKQQITFQVRGKPMRRITCRVGDVPRVGGDVPRTCCETQSLQLHPLLPPFPGPPRGTRWPRWDSDCALVDHLASSSTFLVDHSQIPWVFPGSPGSPQTLC